MLAPYILEAERIRGKIHGMIVSNSNFEDLTVELQEQLMNIDRETSNFQVMLRVALKTSKIK